MADGQLDFASLAISSYTTHEHVTYSFLRRMGLHMAEYCLTSMLRLSSGRGTERSLILSLKVKGVKLLGQDVLALLPYCCRSLFFLFVFTQLAVVPSELEIV